MRHIKNANCVAHSSMLSHGARIPDRHQPATEITQLRAKGNVALMQW
jgi:hypothetical protein